MQPKGEAHLIGNGYSLTPECLDALIGKVTFGMNNISAMFGRTAWRPTYYVMVTTRYMHDNEFRVRAEEAVSVATISFIDAAYREKEFFRGRENIYFVETHERLEWNTDLCTISKYATSMLSTIQIASMLGYAPLYLYGVDGYRKEGCNHFPGGEYNTVEIEADEENANMRAAYAFAKAHCPAQIYDLTESEGYGVFDRLA